MSKILPKILALDFDGVLCNGMGEYFQSSKRAYQQIWQPNENSDQSLEELAPKFALLRPVIETGWEMPLLIRVLILGIPEEKILKNWATVSQQIISKENLDVKILAHTLDTIRDQWIKNDLESWLNLHQFYEGVVNKLNSLISSPILLYIVTTKEGRFVKQLLYNNGVNFPEYCILGKEVKRPKYETLRELLKINSEEPRNLWFVEDFLKPLQLVQQQSELKEVKLFLAAWGYNTQNTRDSLANNSAIKLLHLEQFNQDFKQW